MKTLSFILLFVLSFQSFGSELAQQRSLNKFLASELSKTYEKSFTQNFEKFNKSQHTVASVLKKHKDLDNSFKQKASLYKNEKLPLLSLSDSWATAAVGSNKLKFSIESLMEGQVYLNEEKLNLRDLENALSAKDLTIKTTQVDFWGQSFNMLINKAHANESDKFEILIFSTLIALKDDFNSSWCMWDSCREVRAKSNFEMTMNAIKLEAIKCENNDRNFSLPTELEDFPNTQMSLTLRDKLVDLFHTFPEGDLTCQKMVEKFRGDEVKKITHRNERRGYGGVDSYTAELNREANKKDFDHYIQNICQPYVDLRNCMINRHDEAKAIYDNTRIHGKRGLRNLSDQYDVLPRGQGIQR